MDPEFNWINLAILSVTLGSIFGFIAILKKENPRALLRNFIGLGSRDRINDPEQIKHDLERLLHAMEVEKLHLDPELTLSKLSKRIGISGDSILAALSFYNHTSFDDFVNVHRANEVIRRLKESGPHDILSLALQSGFQSYATFQRVFKNITGKSPRDYKVSRMEKMSSN